ncbi:hypothetical protein [Fundidesulfovibrio soli]|uniref:hypothetical protein n=1 Tax=Fundidesulfovibrio soli TaxID=2922716 RepID=UPI001FAE94CA|nr:hypothetical protein [Fundidesulfovibrio soli]
MSASQASQWAARRRAALMRPARWFAAGATCLILLAGGWLALREARLQRQPGRTDQAVAALRDEQVMLRLKHLALAANLAKVLNNSLLADITGELSTEHPCVQAPRLDGHGPDSPCAARWNRALDAVWAKAFGPQAGPPPDWLRRDLWGRPVLLNEGESVCQSPVVDCVNDTLRSAGPDGVVNTADDLIARVPPFLGPELHRRAVESARQNP